ncbi:receptor-type tyrosine-protein phosphatase eta-like isoform X7 [Thunnus maccoyii]|uniref:receptor-type tyrosine-protein phosphatase eta-like isoform X7 n=1 Tax=Thunnus maccoyii TaxID=8240 RepID=UPI001C4B2AB4|nr:receptor-type tyrosine-protein phosphatase eta-like isoform X7 [Thunnus maccoyii]
MWDKVNNISTYFLEYVNNDSVKVDNINAPHQETSVTHVVAHLSAGTKYNFSLVTFNGANSPGYSFSAVTAPLNAKEFKSDGQTETSITLQWNTVEDILNYRLVFNGSEINVTASADQGTYTIQGLTSGTKYDFTLFTVFENVRSSGIKLTAVTEPRNAEDFKSVGQNETSITLQWNKVDDILNYTLVFNGSEINVTASADQGTYTIPGLTSGTKYNFTLFTVFETVRSSGINLTAVTEPRNAEDFKSVRQTETSITLQWNKVEDILNYTLVFNGSEINVTASADQVTHKVSGLTSGTKYDFTLFTVFENVRSSGVKLTAVTEPRNAEDFKSDGQTETSITLQWNKVEDILNYTLVFNGSEINVTASADQGTYTHSGLTSGTKYDFTLFTVFETVRSSGVNLTAVTEPRNAEEFKSVGQTETSITLQWNKVHDILNYILVFNGREINITASADQVTHKVSGLTSGTKYDFTLFTVFENVRSSGVNLTAVTEPRNAEDFKSIGQTETSITLQWNKVEDILNYTLVFNGREIYITASADQVTHKVSELTSGTKYDFTLFTVSENVRSSGVNLTAVTEPRNAEDFKSVGQTETSITLQWNKVEDIHNYTLVFNGREINVTASADPVTYTHSGLTSGTKYDFTLFTVFETIRSSGVKLTAVTEPRNAEDFKSVRQTETSITLQWNKVEDILNYTLVFNGSEINVTASADQGTYTHSGLTSATKYDFTLFTVFETVRSSGVNLTAVTEPRNAEEFKSVRQTETSITLQWNKVDDILNYILVFNGKEINVTASADQVTYTIPGLTSGTKYNFTLFTVFETVRSSGAKLTAVTEPRNAEDFKSVGQTETSITLQWNKVDDILNYTLVFNGSEINVTASADQVTHKVSGLTSGTKYDFTLFTVFENVKSSGVNLTAVTEPRNAEDFKSVGQTETSITLQWNKVEDIHNYTLVFNGSEINVTASADQVTHKVSGLTSGTKYDFTLFTVFETVRSSGVNLTAVTEPRNAEDFKSDGQTETSITLQWNKVEDIHNYTLVFNGREINVTASADQVTHKVSGLTSATKYDFTLFTVFETVRSSGVNLTAVTEPVNAEDFKSVGQNETSITLQWNKVDDILNYTLVFNGSEINVTASADQGTYTISGLTSGTKYDFTLFAVFENVRSSGVNLTAVTEPRNAEDFKSIGQTETSITLQWNKVEDILNYTLVFNGREINVTASADQVTHKVSGLTSGTKYDFTLFTVFENVRSSGVKLTAVTEPRNAEDFKSVGQNETSITLQWNKVEDILNYTLVFNGREINVTASADQVTHKVSGLTSATKYDFTLFTVFENVRSSGVKLTAVTEPRNAEDFKSVGQTETSITLQWNKVDDILNYTLVFNGREINVTASADQGTHKVSGLTSGTKYDFTLFTVFETIRSSGVKLTAVTVPPTVDFVNVTTRTVNSITLEWKIVNKTWSYFLQIDGKIIPVEPNKSSNVVSHSVPSLRPGTEYQFSVTTSFYELNSTAFKGFTVTAINCSSVTWHVTSSSIQGTVGGLFSKATATNGSKEIPANPEGSNVSFTGLYPGANYSVSLVYERNSIFFPQCDHVLTIPPSDLTARCEYWAAGYSILIVFDKPDGLWTTVEVNVTGKTYKEHNNETQDIEIAGFQPARTYGVSLALISGNVRSRKPYVFQCPTDPRGVIAGSVIAILLFIILVCLAVFILFLRPDIIRKKTFIEGSRLSNKSKAISIAKFPDHFYHLSADENRGFSEEYENLLPVGTEQTRKVALLPENKVKNRFSNVLPYDWCRVRLTTSNPDGISDYINASYMPGYSSNREYIATQGPLPGTVNDFWRMIWEQRVRGIVMVTNCIEGGRTKCEQYWPADSETCLYGEMLVTTSSEEQESNWTLREFRVKHKNTSQERIVKHFHFTAWPDHGVPQGTGVLIQFRELVRHYIQREGTGEPTVVHCSAGVGRTGTIITLDVLLQELERERAVGINAFVHKMRLSRPHMVQTESQYIFLHQCIMDCLQPDEKTEDNVYENVDMIYVNATALREFR